MKETSSDLLLSLKSQGQDFILITRCCYRLSFSHHSTSVLFWIRSRTSVDLCQFTVCYTCTYSLVSCMIFLFVMTVSSIIRFDCVHCWIRMVFLNFRADCSSYIFYFQLCADIYFIIFFSVYILRILNLYLYVSHIDVYASN